MVVKLHMTVVDQVEHKGLDSGPLATTRTASIENPATLDDALRFLGNALDMGLRECSASVAAKLQAFIADIETRKIEQPMLPGTTPDPVEPPQ